MGKNVTAKDNGGVSGTAFIRLDLETAYALAFACTKLGIGKQEYVLTIIRRSLGLSDTPDPDPAVPSGVPEVAPILEVGKDVPPVVAAQIARQLPGVSVVRDSEPAPASSRSRGCQLPSDFRSAERVLIDYAASLGVFDPAAELDQFCDHHTAKGSIFKDWTAAWRTWCRNALKYQSQRAPNATSMHREKMRVAAQIFGPGHSIDLFGTFIEGSAKRVP